MESSVVDYRRLKRVSVPNDEKINLTHWCVLIFAILFMYIFKRIKDKKSYQQL